MNSKRIATWVAAAVLALAAVIALAWPHTTSSETTAKHDDADLRQELIEHRDSLRELVRVSKQLEEAEQKLERAEKRLLKAPTRSKRAQTNLDETRRLRRELEQQLRAIESELESD